MCLHQRKNINKWALERCRGRPQPQTYGSETGLSYSSHSGTVEGHLTVPAAGQRGRAHVQHGAQESTGDLRPCWQWEQRGGHNKGQQERKRMFDPKGTLPPARHQAAVKPHVFKACTGRRACCGSRILIFWSLFRKALLGAHRAQAQSQKCV